MPRVNRHFSSDITRGAHLPSLKRRFQPDHLAAGLQGLAGPDQIVIAAPTRRLIGENFELVELGARALKGFAEPVSAWRITGIAATEGRCEATRGGRLTPFVGRDFELALLLERWEQAGGGGQAVLVVGEQGSRGRPDRHGPHEPHPRQRLILRLRKDTVSRIIWRVDPMQMQVTPCRNEVP